MVEQLPWWQAFLLGVVQGLTEFLPVSSSGHLALAESFLEVPGGGVAFAVLLHAGTLLAIAIVFRDGLKRVMVGLVELPRGLGRSPGEWSAESRLAARLAVATIPGALVGLLLEDRIEVAFGSPSVVGGLLLATATFLLASRWIPRGEKEVGWGTAWWIGCAQAFAILPGISRSGATIVCALALGVARPRAAEFSFLAAVPLILGSLVLQLPELGESASSGSTPSLALGFLTSFLVGWAALRWLVALVHRGQLHWFAAYCAVVGLVALLAPPPGTPLPG